MEPIRTSYAHLTLKGEGYLDLPATAWEDAENENIIQYETAWRPSAEELADLLNGGTLYLYTLARRDHGFPPVMLTTRTLVTDSPEGKEEQAREDRRNEPAALVALGTILEDMRAYENTLKKPELLAFVKARNFRTLAWFMAVLSRKNPKAEAGRDISRIKNYMKKAPIFRG